MSSYGLAVTTVMPATRSCVWEDSSTECEIWRKKSGTKKLCHIFGYILSQYGYILSQYGYILSQYWYIMSQYGYILSQYVYILSQYGYILSQYWYILSQYGYIRFDSVTDGVVKRTTKLIHWTAHVNFDIMLSIFIYLFIYLFTAIVLPPGGSGRHTCTKTGNRQHKRRNSTQNSTKLEIHKEYQNISRVFRKYQLEANNSDTTYCTEHTYIYITVNK